MSASADIRTQFEQYQEIRAALLKWVHETLLTRNRSAFYVVVRREPRGTRHDAAMQQLASPGVVYEH